MKNWKNKFFVCTAASMLLLSRSMTVLAVSEADVEAVGKETASGNLLIWFLCAIAFLKVSQKIDSFMGSLGVNVGHTGGSMIAEMLIAARGITTVKNISGGGSFHGGSFHGGGNTSNINNTSFLSGGLAGAVGRQFAQSAILSVKIRSLEDISVRADVKSVNGNTRKANLGKCKIQGKYAGTVTDIHKGTVFVRLHIGVNAIAHSCYDSRMPGKKDDVSFVVTRIDEERNVAVGLISRIISQNI